MVAQAHIFIIILGVFLVHLKHFVIEMEDSIPAVGRAKLKEEENHLEKPIVGKNKKEKGTENPKEKKAKETTTKKSSSKIQSSSTRAKSVSKIPSKKVNFNAYNEMEIVEKPTRNPNTYKGPEVDLPDYYDYHAIEQGEQIKELIADSPLSGLLTKLKELKGNKTVKELEVDDTIKEELFESIKETEVWGKKLKQLMPKSGETDGSTDDTIDKTTDEEDTNNDPNSTNDETTEDTINDVIDADDIIKEATDPDNTIVETINANDIDDYNTAETEDMDESKKSDIRIGRS